MQVDERPPGDRYYYWINCYCLMIIIGLLLFNVFIEPQIKQPRSPHAHKGVLLEYFNGIFRILLEYLEIFYRLRVVLYTNEHLGAT